MSEDYTKGYNSPSRNDAVCWKRIKVLDKWGQVWWKRIEYLAINIIDESDDANLFLFLSFAIHLWKA